MTVKEGEMAPDFTLETDSGKPLSLHELRGKKVVLYFYPKDDTPGCTKEACELRDAFPRFATAGAVILGVSPDSVSSHADFKAKFELPFTLLSDTNHAMAEQYGVWVEKTMYGRKRWGVARTTFIIDRDGRVAKVFHKVKPEGHAAEVTESLQSVR